jgi:hypothetical protein
MNKTGELFKDFVTQDGIRKYRPILTASLNGKGVLDVDTVKGCRLGMRNYPDGGCYSECYAFKTANQYRIDFSTSVSRKPGKRTFRLVFFAVKDHSAAWYRIGTAGDPSHDWDNTIMVCEMLKQTGKIPVIITKHWETLSDAQIKRLKAVSAVINTSVSAMDTDDELGYRIRQIERLKHHGVKSVCRVITCKYGDTEWGRASKEKQEYLLSILPVIDNPLRADKSNERVIAGDIVLERNDESVGGGKFISMHDKSVHIGMCYKCKDQCGVTF